MIVAAVPEASASPLRAGQYLRVSLDKTGRAASVDQQQVDNERDAERHGWTMAETYRDVSISASRFTRKVREDYARLLADLEAGKLDVLILWEPSRGSRKVSEWARLVELCEENKVAIYVTSHGRAYDMTNPRDRRSLMEDAVDSEYESGKVSVRVKRSAAANAAAGKPHGRIPFGFERIYDERTKRFIEQRPKPHEAAVVRKIIADIAAGKSIKAVTRELNEGSVPTKTGVPWTWSVVRQIALNITYIGKRTHHGAVTDATWPPLVDEATFYAARRVLTDPARKTTKPGKARHLVSMIARCAECGGPLTVTNRTGKGETYFCRDKSCLYISKASLEHYVTREVRFRLEQPEMWARYAATAADDSAVLAARDEAARLRAELHDLYDEVAAGRVSAAALARIEPQMLARVAEAEERARASTVPPALRAYLHDGRPADVAQVWADAPVSAQRDVIRELVESLVVRRSPIRGHRVDAAERTKLTWRKS